MASAVEQNKKLSPKKNLGVRFILMNDPQAPKKKIDTVFYANDDWRCIHLNMEEQKDWGRIDNWVERLRKIIDRCGIFRSEDVDTIKWNSAKFATEAKNHFMISGSTYVSDGRLQLFLDSIAEIEEKVASFRD